MSSYRMHALAGILMSLPFAPSILYLFFALIGASIPDLDHGLNKRKVFILLGIGIVLSILLFINGISSISGIILILLAIIFYFSKHRGFTHSFIGVLCLVSMVYCFIIGSMPLFSMYHVPANISFFIVLLVLGVVLVSRYLLSLYVFLLLIVSFINPLDYNSIKWSYILIMLIIGVFSHLILDLFTPNGLKVLYPFSNITFHKWMGLFLLFIWVVITVWYVLNSFGILLNIT
ncbi:MAG: metal-dependent hydrolase [Methanobacteriaceae archaeon]|nr:metal-dependent hydrolase [Methanobacteriaceae archaeon]